MPWFLFCWLLGIAALPDLRAADADSLAKQADTELRSAERDFFNGKLESADTRLSQAAKLLDELRITDAAHRNLKCSDCRAG